MKQTGVVYVFLSALLFCAPHAFAQNGYIEDPKVFTGGPILGVNFTQVDGDSYYGYHKVGLTAGGVVYVHFTQWFGASMELVYTQKGSRGVNVTESPYIGTYVEKYSMNLNYVEVPVLLHAKSNRVDFEAGVAYARLINSKEWAQADVPVIIDPEYNKFNTTDIDYLIGGSINIYKQLYLNIRYQYSIASIRDSYRIPVGFGYGGSGQFNNMFTARLMYLF